MMTVILYRDRNALNVDAFSSPTLVQQSKQAAKPKIDPLPEKIISLDYSRRQLTSVPPQVWQSTGATILSTALAFLDWRCTTGD